MEKLLRGYKENMRKIFFIVILVLLLNIGLVSAHEHNLVETKQLIDSGVSCDKLSDEQLEAFGDYYMEQMHPGESHEMMDKMMGGEGSESLRQVHINMAKRLYCNEDTGGMMGSGGMMNMMMGNWGYSSDYGDFWNIIWLLFWVGIIILIVWLTATLIQNNRR